jgi:ribonuclease D
MQWHYIDTDAALAAAAKIWQTSILLALDTEFVRVDTYYPRLGLIQLSDGQEVWLIDPLCIRDWQPFCAVMTQPSILKVLHSCSEDMETLKHHLKLIPSPVMDTQIAAGMAGFDGVMSYQRLVKATMDLDIDKDETRSDWMARPLSQGQLTYAAADVLHLVTVANMLREKLHNMGRLGWIDEDMAKLVTEWQKDSSDKMLYAKVKQAWMLRPQQLAVLERLTLWREERCKELDIPRPRLLNDAALMELAKRLPRDEKQLFQFRDIKPNVVRKEGGTIITLIEAGADSPQENWPERLAKPLSPQAGEWFKDMRALVAKKATELGIPPELLARKKPLEWMLRQGYPRGPYPVPDDLLGWRENVIVQPLQQLLFNLSGK